MVIAIMATMTGQEKDTVIVLIMRLYSKGSQGRMILYVRGSLHPTQLHPAFLRPENGEPRQRGFLHGAEQLP